jgi:amino acid transporter
MGIEMTAKVNMVMLVAELVVLAIFIVIGVVALAQGKGHGFDFTPVYNSHTFSLSLVFGAVSVAVLSFLGFDGISTLAEENKDSARAIGRSMIAALLLAGVLFIVQTWVASLLVPHPGQLISKGDPGGTAFYDAAAVAGGQWLSKLTALATAIAWGFANALVAQAATSRLLYAMARDRQLPSFLAKVHERKGVPVNATFLVAVVSLAVGLFFYSLTNGITTLSTLVNFGALTAFLALHVSVVWHYVGRQGSRRWWIHLVAPVIGFVILAYVLVNAQVYAQALALVWFVVGLIIMIVLVASGRSPDLNLSEETSR